MWYGVGRFHGEREPTTQRAKKVNKGDRQQKQMGESEREYQ